MTENEIKEMFFEAIQERGIYKNINVTRAVVYNWKNNRGSEPSIGQMLDVLYRIGLIKITKIQNE